MSRLRARLALWLDGWRRERDLLLWLRRKAFSEVGKPAVVMIYGKPAVITSMSVDMGDRYGQETGKISFDYIIVSGK